MRFGTCFNLTGFNVVGFVLVVFLLNADVASVAEVFKRTAVEGWTIFPMFAVTFCVLIGARFTSGFALLATGITGLFLGCVWGCGTQEV